jgi:hypothetical protein
MTDQIDTTEIDTWLNAIARCVQTRDGEPLARLFRDIGRTPMPGGVGEVFAELFSPSGDLPVEYYVLVPKRNPEFDKMLKKFIATAEYRIAMDTGKASKVVAKETAKKYGVTDRHLFRWIRENIPQRLAARLRGKDTPSSER